jgi:putative Holliday junction resolvase
VKVIALDHGAARTGVAVCDETGTVARPLTVVERVGTEAGFSTLLSLISAERPERIVVGLPLSLDGRERAQARLARTFSERLRAVVEVPVVLFDERFTTKLADQRGGAAPRDARAAATLLEDYLGTVHEQAT